MYSVFYYIHVQRQCIVRSTTYSVFYKLKRCSLILLVTQATTDVNSTITSLYLEVQYYDPIYIYMYIQPRSIVQCNSYCRMTRNSLGRGIPWGSPLGSPPNLHPSSSLSLSPLLLQSSNSASYVQDALQLLKPVLQYSVLHKATLHEPGPNVHARS